MDEQLNNNARFNPTDMIGESFLNLCFLKEIGWIVRDIHKSDVGIDANVEQVTKGNPTAKYISVQLKTGFGNIYKTKEGNVFIFYFNSVHYQYWLSSSIPVIIALCDPDKGTIYWELLKKRNIEKTDKRYKIAIKKSHILNKESLEELENIIDTYQSEFQLEDDDDFEEYDFVEYVDSLFSECIDVLHNCDVLFNQLDNKYEIFTEKTLKILESQDNNQENKKRLKTYTKSLADAIKICSSQLHCKIPIIAKTYIKAIRFIEYALSKHKMTQEEFSTIKIIFDEAIENILDVAECAGQASKQYRNSVGYDQKIERAYFSLSDTLDDYRSELLDIIEYIKRLTSNMKKVY